jgi:hypothetical protein
MLIYEDRYDETDGLSKSQLKDLLLDHQFEAVLTDLLWKNQIMEKWKNDYSSKEEEEVEGGQKKKKI